MGFIKLWVHRLLSNWSPEIDRSGQKADRKWTRTVCGSIKGFNSSVQDQSVLKYCHPFFKQLDVLEKNAVPGTGKGNYSRNLESTFMRKDDYIRARGHPPNDYILLSVSKISNNQVKILRNDKNVT